MSRKTLLVIASAALVATHQFFSSGETAPDFSLQQTNAMDTPHSPLQPLAPPAVMNSVSSVPLKATSQSNLSDDEGLNPDYPTFAMRYDEVVARRNGAAIPAINVKHALQLKAAWSTDDTAADALDLDPEDRFDGRSFIRFNPMKLESLVAGDHMEIPLDETQQTYTFEVDQVQVNDEESISWVGHLTESETDNQVIFTQSSNLTYAGIQTPEGLFVLEAKGTQGWIAPAGLIFKGSCDALPVDTETGTAEHPHNHNHTHNHSEGAHDHDTVM